MFSKNDTSLEKGEPLYGFRYNLAKFKASDIMMTGEDYLRNSIKSNITVKSLNDFYKNNISDESILNEYIKILDVYNEYLFAKASKSEKPVKIKIFDTTSLSKILKQCKIRGTNLEIDEALEDFIDCDTIIVPFFKEDIEKSCIVIIKFVETTCIAHLFLYQQEDNEEETYQISQDVQDLVSYAFF